MNVSGLPSRTTTIFAASGEYNTIADTSTSATLADGTVTMDVGYPPLTMTPIASGGVPPSGEDTNGIFNRVFTKLQWEDAGGGYPFSASFASSVGGYPKGAVVPTSDYLGSWINTVDANSTNPETTGAATTGWIPYAETGITSITGLSSTSVSLTTRQANCKRIALYGTLTANINIIVPAWAKSWSIANACTGTGFYVIVKTASGTGVQVNVSETQNVICDGTSVFKAFGSLSQYDLAPITMGGTGASTASAALANLGISGTQAQKGHLQIGKFLFQWVHNSSTSNGFTYVTFEKKFSSVYGCQNTVLRTANSGSGDNNWSTYYGLTTSGVYAGSDQYGSDVFAYGLA